jgi:hypothetical protein
MRFGSTQAGGAGLLGYSVMMGSIRMVSTT